MRPNVLHLAASLALLVATASSSQAASPMEPILRRCPERTCSVFECRDWHPEIQQTHILRVGEGFEILTMEGPAQPGDPSGISQSCAGFNAYLVIAGGTEPTNITVNWDFDRYPIAARRLSCANGADCTSERDCRDVGSTRCVERDSCPHGHLDYAVYTRIPVPGTWFFTFTGGGGKDGDRQGSECVFTTHPSSEIGHEFWGTDSVSVSGNDPNGAVEMIVLVQGHSHGAVRCGNFQCFPGGLLRVQR